MYVRARFCPTRRNTMKCSLPGSSVHGISQARMLELPFPSPGDLPNLGLKPQVSCIGREVLYRWATREDHIKGHHSINQCFWDLIFLQEYLSKSQLQVAVTYSCSPLQKIALCYDISVYVAIVLSSGYLRCFYALTETFIERLVWGMSCTHDRCKQWSAHGQSCSTRITPTPVLDCACVLSRFCHVSLSAAPWTVAHQAPLSKGFFRQEYWSGLAFPSP